MIEFNITGKNWSEAQRFGMQARFSTLEFQKSVDGCTQCRALTCGKGTCLSSTVYDMVHQMHGDGSVNTFNDETPVEVPPACKCTPGVSGSACETGACAAVVCNEPFGGDCIAGACECKNGH